MADERFAAVTMVKDDLFFLKKWIDYYGRMFTRKNLYIINHGRQSDVSDLAQGCNVIGIPQGDNRKFDIKRWRLLNDIVHGMLGYYDQIIVGDVDEFVVADPLVAPDLPSLLRKHVKKTILTPIGLEVTHLPAVETQPVTSVILGPRQHVQLASEYSKPCIVNGFTKISRGGHYADCEELTAPPGLYLFHMRYADLGIYADTMDRRNKVVSETGAQKPQDVMIGRHWFAGQRQDNAIFDAFAAREVRPDFDLEPVRLGMETSWKKRETKGGFWQFDEEPQDCLYRLPVRFFGLV